MDTRAPRGSARRLSKAGKPKVIRRATLTGDPALHEFDKLLNEMQADMRRRGMTDADVKDLRKWLRNG